MEGEEGRRLRGILWVKVNRTFVSLQGRNEVGGGDGKPYFRLEPSRVTGTLRGENRPRDLNYSWCAHD